MAINFTFSDDLVAAMLAEFNTELNALTAGNLTAAWALYTGAVGAGPNTVPAGTLIKVGDLNATPFAVATVSGGEDATRKHVLTLNAEGTNQLHGSAAGASETAGVLALFKGVDVTGVIATAEADLISANLVIKGNADIAANTPWCTLGSTTITTADVDLTQANCLINLPQTQST